MNMIRDIRGGKDNDPRFKTRMRGEGVYAEMIEQRFRKICNDLGLNKKRITLDVARFTPPAQPND